MTTKKGLQLAAALAPSIGVSAKINQVCALLCRSATTYKRVQEGFCNGHPVMSSPDVPIEQANKMQSEYSDWLMKQEQRLEKRINALVSELPKQNGESIRVHFSGDPRGATVKLVMPDGRFDDWGGIGICVPGS